MYEPESSVTNLRYVMVKVWIIFDLQSYVIFLYFVHVGMVTYV